METAEKYIDCNKEDVILNVPDHLWGEWFEHASEKDKTDETFMKKIVLRRGECLRFAPDSLKSDPHTVLKEDRRAACCGAEK